MNVININGTSIDISNVVLYRNGIEGIEVITKQDNRTVCYTIPYGLIGYDKLSASMKQILDTKVEKRRIIEPKTNEEKDDEVLNVVYADGDSVIFNKGLIDIVEDVKNKQLMQREKKTTTHKGEIISDFNNDSLNQDHNEKQKREYQIMKINKYRERADGVNDTSTFALVSSGILACVIALFGVKGAPYEALIALKGVAIGGSFLSIVTFAYASLISKSICNKIGIIKKEFGITDEEVKQYNIKHDLIEENGGKKK